MERTIDRTSYRRNVRSCSKKQTEKKKRFLYLESFLNQIIISLLIMAAVLAAKYFEINEVEEWLSKNMSNGYEISEIVNLLKDRNPFNKYNEIVITKSGEDIFEINTSGENSEVSGDFIFQTAVEGISQMSEDAKFLLDNYEFILPLKGVLTSAFGCRTSDSNIVSSYHSGIDIAANSGTNIVASHSGIVTLARNYSSYGNCVIIESGELMTLYAHCSSLNVEVGQKVDKGEKIAKVGMTGNATGPHLHFEVRYQERFVDPKNILGEI